MDWGGPGFVLTIIMISTVGWLVNNWIRAKHGYALEDELFGKTEKTDTVREERLAQQNQQLIETMEKMQDRMVVLERIVTDKGYRVSEEIEALRDKPASVSATDNGVPLNFGKKEEV
ncbi:hypothetical protein [Aurantiacibacter sp. D1-12]|uniref:hypothetical protein n=1 Tax=Aurantiacibacter sp. D1-12 TaxID=2993658 RepID=UPI00237CE9C2|nr:hypothetical protein [Aurantiacibacter sp. D1-12]MDE1466158.1 hypothetical protein [Aurantiacibacter sp. D1-12]